MKSKFPNNYRIVGHECSSRPIIPNHWSILGRRCFYQSPTILTYCESRTLPAITCNSSRLMHCVNLQWHTRTWTTDHGTFCVSIHNYLYMIVWLIRYVEGKCNILISSNGVGVVEPIESDIFIVIASCMYQNLASSMNNIWPTQTKI